MSCVSRSTLEHRLARVASLTKQPLRLTTWAPGDGWTRYRVCDQRDQPVSSRYYRLHEINAYVSGLLDGAILMEERK